MLVAASRMATTTGCRRELQCVRSRLTTSKTATSSRRVFVCVISSAGSGFWSFAPSAATATAEANIVAGWSLSCCAMADSEKPPVGTGSAPKGASPSSMNSIYRRDGRQLHRPPASVSMASVKGCRGVPLRVEGGGGRSIRQKGLLLDYDLEL